MSPRHEILATCLPSSDSPSSCSTSLPPLILTALQPVLPVPLIQIFWFWSWGHQQVQPVDASRIESFGFDSRASKGSTCWCPRNETHSDLNEGEQVELLMPRGINSSTCSPSFRGIRLNCWFSRQRTVQPVLPHSDQVELLMPRGIDSSTCSPSFRGDQVELLILEASTVQPVLPHSETGWTVAASRQRNQKFWICGKLIQIFWFWCLEASTVQPVPPHSDQVELLILEASTVQPVLPHSDQVELLILEASTVQPVLPHSDQVELLLPRAINSSICSPLIQRGSGWTVDASRQQQFNLFPLIQGDQIELLILEASTVQPVPPHSDQVELLILEASTVQPVPPHSGGIRLNCWCLEASKQFNLFPLIQIFWFCSWGHQQIQSVDARRFRSFGFDPEGINRFNLLMPKNQIFWFWFSGINRLNCWCPQERNQKTWMRDQQVEPVDALSERNQKIFWILLLGHQQVQSVDARESFKRSFGFDPRASTGSTCWCPWGSDLMVLILRQGEQVQPVDPSRIKSKRFWRTGNRHQQFMPEERNQKIWMSFAPRASTGSICWCPRIRIFWIWMRGEPVDGGTKPSEWGGNRFNLLMPYDQNQRSEWGGTGWTVDARGIKTKRSEWGGTGWTVDARGAKPKDLNEGEQVELLMPENRSAWTGSTCWCPQDQIWMRASTGWTVDARESKPKDLKEGGTDWTVDARGAKPKDLNEGEQIELLMPEDQNQKIWMRGEQVELLMPEEQNSFRSEWGGTGWTVDARGTKPKDLNEGGTDWTVDARGSKPKDLNEGEQIELLMPEDQNQKIWMRGIRLVVDFSGINSSTWSPWIRGIFWLLMPEASKPKDLNEGEQVETVDSRGINSSTWSPSFRTGWCWCPWGINTVQIWIPPHSGLNWFWCLEASNSSKGGWIKGIFWTLISDGINSSKVLIQGDLLQLWSSGINSSTCSPSFRSFGFDPRASTVLPVLPHSDLLNCWFSGINSSTCSPSFRGIRLNCWCLEASTVQPVLPHSDQVELFAASRQQQFNLFPLIQGDQVELLMPRGIEQFNLFPLIQIFWFWSSGINRFNLFPLDERNFWFWFSGINRFNLLMPRGAKLLVLILRASTGSTCWCLRIRSFGFDPEGINRFNLLMPRGSDLLVLILRHQQVQPVDARDSDLLVLLLRASTGSICSPLEDQIFWFRSSSINRFNLFPPRGSDLLVSFLRASTGSTCWCPRNSDLLVSFWMRASTGSTCSPSCPRIKTKSFDPEGINRFNLLIPRGADLLVLILGHQQFNLFPLIQIFWFWSSGINSSICSPSFRSFGFDSQASTVQPVLPHSDLLVLLLGHQQFNLFPPHSDLLVSFLEHQQFNLFPPHSDLLVSFLGHQQFNLFSLIQIFWFCSSGINSSTCSPSFRSFGFAPRASTVQPVPPHSDLLVLILGHQQFSGVFRGEADEPWPPFAKKISFGHRKK